MPSQFNLFILLIWERVESRFEQKSKRKSFKKKESRVAVTFTLMRLPEWCFKPCKVEISLLQELRSGFGEDYMASVWQPPAQNKKILQDFGRPSTEFKIESIEGEGKRSKRERIEGLRWERKKKWNRSDKKKFSSVFIYKATDFIYKNIISPTYETIVKATRVKAQNLIY